MPVIKLSNGRRLAYERLGDPDGRPVIVLHGTPGSSRQLVAFDSPARERGIALIAPDRSGYGGSTHDRARTIASAARDLGELVAQLGLKQCAMIGLSGGGPTALGCGVLVGEKVSAVATVGGVGPLVPRDPSLPPDRLVTRIARHSESAARALFEVMVRSGRAKPEKALARFTALLAEPDARLLRENSALRRAFLDELRMASPTTASAAARDFRLFARPWDVELAEMKVRAHIWHGTLDRNVPVQHAHVIAARCPGAELNLVAGGGHMLLAQMDEIIGGVVAASTEAGAQHPADRSAQRPMG